MGNTAFDNQIHGIATCEGSTVVGNTSWGNGAIGITASIASTVSGNTVYQNSGIGIEASSSTVSGNTVYANGGDGIWTRNGSSIQRNAVRSNGSIVGGYGLKLGSDDTYRENTITDNFTGGVNGSGVNLGANYCAGTGVVSASCP